MKASEIHLAVSPLSNTIYGGKVAKNGMEWTQKHDVTEQVLSAVAQYMNGTYSEIEFPAGTLKWEPKEEE